jgi:hypothetical protein
MSIPAASWRGAVLLFAALWGCAMPAAVRQADELYASGDLLEAEEAYRRSIQESWLTRDEFEHVATRLKEASATELQRRLQLMEPRLAVRPAEELLPELLQMRAELAERVGDPKQDRWLADAMQRVVERAWPKVEELLASRKYRAALERAYQLAIFFPRRDPIWREVERIQEAAKTWPELPEVPEQPFPPEAEDYLRLVQEHLEAGRPEQARVALVLAALAANMPMDTFMARLSVVYGAYAPFLLQPVPQPPEVPKNVQSAEQPLRLVHGSVGKTADKWQDLPEEDGAAARGVAAYGADWGGFYVAASDIPTQRDRVAGAFNFRVQSSLVSIYLKDPWGWTIQDHFMVEILLGRRVSSPHVYPIGPEPGTKEGGWSLGGTWGWTLLTGYRGRHVGLLLGARPQLVAYRLGDITAAGTMLPLVGWLELRWNERYPIVLQGWATPWADSNSTRGVRLRIPLSPTWGLVGRYEELRLESRMGGLESADRIDIDRRPSTRISLSVSMFL